VIGALRRALSRGSRGAWYWHGLAESVSGILRERAQASTLITRTQLKPNPSAAGATGGFAAGEKGVKQFVRDGELQLRKEGQPGGNQSSPVALAGLLVLAGAGGGVLLNAVADLTASGIKAEIANVGCFLWFWVGVFWVGGRGDGPRCAVCLQLAVVDGGDPSDG